MASLGGIIKDQVTGGSDQEEKEDDSVSDAAKQELKKAKDILTGKPGNKSSKSYSDEAEKAKDILSGDNQDTAGDKDNEESVTSNNEEVSNPEPEKTQDKASNNQGKQELNKFKEAAGLKKPSGEVDASKVPNDTLSRLSAKKALGQEVTKDIGPAVPEKVNYNDKDSARLAVYSSVSEKPEVADYARTLRSDSEDKQEFVKDAIKNDPDVTVDEVQRFNDIVNRNDLQNNNLNVLVGSAQASTASERFTERFENNPVSDSVGRLFAGIGAAGDEASDVVTGQGFNRTEKEQQATLQARNEISGFVTDAGAQTAALPGTLQAWSGEVSRLLSGDKDAGNAAEDIGSGFKKSGQRLKESVQEDPYTTGVKGGLAVGFAGTTYYGSRFVRTGRKPNLDVDASTLAKKGRSKARSVEERLKVAGEPVKSTDKYRVRPASRDGSLPTGKEVDSGRDIAGGTSSNAFPTSLDKKTSLKELAMGKGPKNTETVRDVFYVDADKYSSGQKVKDGKQFTVIGQRRPDQELVEEDKSTLEMRVDDVRVTGQQSGLEAVVSQDTDVSLKGEKDVSELVDVADDSGSSGRTRKGQLTLSRKKTKSEKTDTTGRKISAEDRRKDVGSDTPDYYDTGVDSRSRRDTNFNNPSEVPGEVTSAGLVVPSDVDNPSTGKGLNLSVNTEQKSKNDSVMQQESGQETGARSETDTGIDAGFRPVNARRRKPKEFERVNEGVGGGREGRREEDRRGRRYRDLDFDLGSDFSNGVETGDEAGGRGRRSSTRLGVDALSAIQTQEQAGDQVSFVGGRRGVEMQSGASETIKGFPTVGQIKDEKDDNDGNGLNGRGDFI